MVSYGPVRLARLAPLLMIRRLRAGPARTRRPTAARRWRSTCSIPPGAQIGAPLRQDDRPARALPHRRRRGGADARARPGALLDLRQRPQPARRCRAIMVTDRRQRRRDGDADRRAGRGVTSASRRRRSTPPRPTSTSASRSTTSSSSTRSSPGRRPSTLRALLYDDKTCAQLPPSPTLPPPARAAVEDGHDGDAAVREPVVDALRARRARRGRRRAARRLRLRRHRRRAGAAGLGVGRAGAAHRGRRVARSAATRWPRRWCRRRRRTPRSSARGSSPRRLPLRRGAGAARRHGHRHRRDDAARSAARRRLPPAVDLFARRTAAVAADRVSDGADPRAAGDRRRSRRHHRVGDGDLDADGDGGERVHFQRRARAPLGRAGRERERVQELRPGRARRAGHRRQGDRALRRRHDGRASARTT